MTDGHARADSSWKPDVHALRDTHLRIPAPWETGTSGHPLLCLLK